MTDRYRVPQCVACGSVALDWDPKRPTLVICLVCDAEQPPEIATAYAAALAAAWPVEYVDQLKHRIMKQLNGYHRR